jgi:hypothetical protein
MAKGTTTRPFLPETTNKSEAFPGIAALEIKVSQDPYGMFVQQEHRRTATYSLHNIPRRVGCLNPKCQQGGFDLQMQVSFGDCVDRKLYCSGHEGTPAGRRKGDPCSNVFTVTVRTERVPAAKRVDGDGGAPTA